MILRLPPLGHLGMPFTREARPVASLPKIINIEFFHRFGLGHIMVAIHPKSPAGQTTEDRGPTHPANRLTDESVGKPGSPSSKSVDIRSLGQRMTIATEGTRSLIIGEEKDDIRALGVRLNKEREHKTEKEEVRIHDFGSKRLFEGSGKIVLEFGVQLF